MASRIVPRFLGSFISFTPLFLCHFEGAIATEKSLLMAIKISQSQKALLRNDRKATSRIKKPASRAGGWFDVHRLLLAKKGKDGNTQGQDGCDHGEGRSGQG